MGAVPALAMLTPRTGAAMDSTTQMIPDPPTIGAITAAHLAGVSIDTLRRLWKKDRFPRPFRVAKCLRWFRADIEGWLLAQAEQAQQPEGAVRG